MDLNKREKIGLTTFIIIIIFIISIMYFNKNKNETIQVVNKDNMEVLNPKVNSNTSPDVSPIGLNKEIKVYISGEVKKPGVYTLQIGDRAERLVELAGGFTDKAETTSLNLAVKLKDEDFIKIPNKTQKVAIANTPIINAASTNSLISNKSSTIEGESSPGGALVNINTANKEQLKELPRIGDAMSQRIIDYREKMGPFKDIKNITDVSGIGTKMFENIKDKITVQ